MKEKSRQYLTENSPELDKSPSMEYSYTFRKKVRRTLGSQDQIEGKQPLDFNTSKLNHFYSPPRYKFDAVDYRTVVDENKKLKEQVRALKELLLDSTTFSKSMDGSIKMRKDEKAEQILKLKKIIEKSYYSLKEMENQISRLNEQLAQTNKNLLMAEKKYKILEFQKEELERKFTGTVLVHKQEMEVCNQKVRRLQLRIKDLVELVEQDQVNWSLHVQELNSLKKFYSKGTSK